MNPPMPLVVPVLPVLPVLQDLVLVLMNSRGANSS